jgi:hypothetical protein
MICSYCGQENSHESTHCTFCEAPLKAKRPFLRDHLFLEQCELLTRSVQKAPEGFVVDSDTLFC